MITPTTRIRTRLWGFLALLFALLRRELTCAAAAASLLFRRVAVLWTLDVAQLEGLAAGEPVLEGDVVMSLVKNVWITFLVTVILPVALAARSSLLSSLYSALPSSRRIRSVYLLATRLSDSWRGTTWTRFHSSTWSAKSEKPAGV